MTAAVGAMGMILASGITAWASSSRAVSDVKTEIATVKITENLHYAEVQKQLTEISRKIDQLVPKTAIK